MVKCFLVLGELGEHCAELQVILAKVPQLEKLTGYVELLDLVRRR